MLIEENDSITYIFDSDADNKRKLFHYSEPDDCLLFVGTISEDDAIELIRHKNNLKNILKHYSVYRNMDIIEQIIKDPPIAEFMQKAFDKEYADDLAEILYNNTGIDLFAIEYMDNIESALKIMKGKM